MTIAEQAKEYAEANELPFIEVGSEPSRPVMVDGQGTPIQSVSGCRKSVIAWLAGTDYGKVEQVVESDGQIGSVNWFRDEIISIEWEDLDLPDGE